MIIAMIYLLKMIENCEVDNHVVRIPIAENISGMVVNKSLLAKEGLNVPTNYKEFIDVLEKLKNKGYTPIQGAYSHAYNDLVINMAMTMIGNDSELLEKFNNLDPTAAQELKPVFEKLDYIIVMVILIMKLMSLILMITMIRLFLSFLKAMFHFGYVIQSQLVV